MIRTTVALPNDLHEELRLLAFQSRKSLSQVVVEKITQGSTQKAADTSADYKLFNAIAKYGKGIDVVKAIREDRDRDNG